MYCPQCGKELLKDSNFCHVCGFALSGNLPKQASEYELCEIFFRIGKPKKSGFFGTSGSEEWDDCYFEAVVAGSGEKIGRSSNIYWTLNVAYLSGRDNNDLMDSKPYRDTVNILIQELTHKGWQILPTAGKYWYSYKCRRQLDSASLAQLTQSKLSRSTNSAFQQTIDESVAHAEASKKYLVLPKLDDIEYKILELLAQGLKVYEFADKLQLSTVATSTRLNELRKRFDVTTNEDLLQQAKKVGYL